MDLKAKILLTILLFCFSIWAGLITANVFGDWEQLAPLIALLGICDIIALVWLWSR